MLNQVEIRTAQNELLSLPLDDITEGYSVEEIEGLDPVKAVIVSSSFANLDGEQYQSARREKRNIILKLGLEQDYVNFTARQLRSKLYEFLMPKSEVNLRFLMDDEAPVSITGRVESFDAPLFTPEPKATISILCFDPDFAEDDTVVLTGTTVNTDTERLVQYKGTIETGFVFTLTANRAMSDFTIFNRSPDGTTRSLEFTADLVAGDIVQISTIAGHKAAVLTRGSTSNPIVYAISPYSDWINLYPGENNVRIYAGGAPVPYAIEYRNKYGGL